MVEVHIIEVEAGLGWIGSHVKSVCRGSGLL
jgi:hypothetical protein